MAGKNIIGGEFEAIGKAMLELNRETVVAGAIVGTEKGKCLASRRAGKIRNKFVAAILMDALLVFVGAVRRQFLPSHREVVFEGGAGLQRVGRVW